jgi:hypothetical protein
MSLRAPKGRSNLIGYPWDRHASLAMTAKEMVELTGIEPATSGVQNRRSPSWATAPKIFPREKFLTGFTEKVSFLRTLRFSLFAQPKFLNN